MNKKKIFLTGSSGFVGGNFIKDYSHTYDIKSFSFLQDDFESLDLKGIDSVVHLAALVHQMGGASKEAYFTTNVDNTVKLARKARDMDVPHFIFMSTVKVYGEETAVPYSENSECIPSDDYGKSKLEAESQLMLLENASFKVSIIRTPIVYGAGVKANILSLIKLVKKLSILPFGSIRNRRSMVYIGNLTHLIDVLIKQGKAGIFLASDDEPFSTTRLIELIAKSLNKNVILFKLPFFETLLKLMRPSFHKRLYQSLELDNHVTKEILNFENRYTSKEGIQLMIDSKVKETI